MGTPGEMAMDTEGGSRRIDFVTIVFAGELPLLKLQARSLAKFAGPYLIGKIILIVNDRNEHALRVRLEAMKCEYGDLADRVEIVLPDEIFHWNVGPSDLIARLKAAYTRHRAMIPVERQNGWRRHRGWQLQQAMKLASVRKTISDFVVILDAKNHFLSPIEHLDFVSPQGRALTYFERIGDWQVRWFRDACKIIGLDANTVSTNAYMPSMTPFVVRRDFLSEVLETVEQRAGPVQVLFGTKRDEVTEFALIFAHCIKLHGSVEGEFDLGLEPAAYTVRDGSDAHNETVLNRVETGKAKVLGLHRLSLRTMSPDHLGRLENLWQRTGLVGADENTALLSGIEQAA